MPIESYESIRAANDRNVASNGGVPYSYLPPSVPTTTAPGSLVPTDSIPPADLPRSQPVREVPRVPNPISIFDTVIGGACTLRRLAPDAFSNLSGRLPGTGRPNNQYRSWQDQFWSRACNDYPPPPPEADPAPNFEGGQCQVRYRIQAFGQTFNNLAGGVSCAPTNFNSGRPEVWGEIESFRVEYTLGGRGINIFCRCHGPSNQTRRTEVVEVSLGTFNSSIGCPAPVINSFDVVRSDGQPDNCGNPAPDYPLTNPPQLNLNFNINVGTPSNPINTPVEIVPLDNGTYDINIGDQTFNFDGINVRYDFGEPGRPPQSNPDGIGFGTGDRERGEDTAVGVEEILEELMQPGGDCDLTPVLDKIDCLDKIIREAAPIELTQDEQPSIVGSISATEEDRVFYVSGARANSAFLVVSLTGAIPDGVRLYTLSGTAQDVEGGFGNWSYFSSIASQNAPNTELRYLFTRQTLIPLRPDSGLNGVRLSLKPGIAVQVFDSGYSYVQKVLSNCEEENV